MTISLRLNDSESVLLKNYAKMKNQTVSDIVRTAIIDRIEEELDLEAYNKAYAEYVSDPVSFTLEEVEKELGF